MSWQNPNFFFDFLGFHLWENIGNGLIHPEMQRKKIHFCGGWYPVLYGTVLYKIVQYTVKIWSVNFFFFCFWMNQDIFICFNVFLGNLKKTQNFGNFPNFRGGGPESLENSKLFLVFRCDSISGFCFFSQSQPLLESTPHSIFN